MISIIHKIAELSWMNEWMNKWVWVFVWKFFFDFDKNFFFENNNNNNKEDKWSIYTTDIKITNRVKWKKIN